MSDPTQLAHDFLAALASNNPTQFEAVLSEDVGMRLNRWDGREIYRPRKRVMQRFIDEWSSWPDPSLEGFDIVGTADRAAVEFRIQATENDRYVEHNRSAFLTIKDDKIHIIDLYCPEPVPSARRKNWIAPATLTDEELNRLFDSMNFSGDSREYIWPNSGGRMSLRGGRWGTGAAHPGSNGVGGVRWTAEEADQKIEATIAYYREHNIGFQWWVNPFDTPTDLRERLERHGLILAGDAATMAHTHLDQLDIPVNPRVEIEVMDGYHEESIDAMLQLMVTCFNMPADEVAERRPIWVERMRDPKERQVHTSYLARLNGQPAGFGRLSLRGGLGYLSAGAVLPEFRGQHVYSTLLRRRLEEAHAQGYHIVAIQAEPLSRPIVTRCGFKEYTRSYIYGWMPVIDVDVIKSLVPQ
jgi:GNAT superfamily N-acetyltransferase